MYRVIPRRGALIALVALAATAQAQSPRTGSAITAADLRTRLFLIADDSMQGREPGGIGDWKAAEYVAGEFRRLGLEPAGDGGGWFQTVPFARLKPDPATRLTAGGTVLLPGGDLLLAGTPTTLRRLNGAPSVYGGPLNDSTRWAPADSIAGRVVVLSVAPGADGVRPSRGVSAMTRNPRFARASLIVLAALDLLGPESVATVSAGRVTVDTVLSVTAAPTIYVTPAGAETILGRPLAGLPAGTAGRPVDAVAGYEVTATRYLARNVVGIVRGSDPTLNHEYIALTAHNDHVGFDRAPVDHDSLRAFDRVVRPAGADSRNREATPDESARIRIILDSLRRLRPARRDSIRNGADDDGSGTVSILEIAERMAGERGRLKRSILFVSHTGEELGLVGSAWYTDHPTVPRDSIVADIDQDMVGRGSAADLPEGGPAYLEVVGARRLSREFGDQLEAANAAQPVPFKFNYAYDVPGHPLQYYCRADHYNYARYSIPAVSFSRGEHLDYHQVTDEPQYIDYDALARVSNMVHDAALLLSGMDHRPALDAPKGDPHAVCRQ